MDAAGFFSGSEEDDEPNAEVIHESIFALMMQGELGRDEGKEDERVGNSDLCFEIG